MTTYAEFREDLHPKDVVLGVGDGDDALGFPRSRLVAAGGIGAATVGERAVVAFATPDGVHGYEHPGVGPGSAAGFEPVGEGRFRADGTVWDGTTGRGEDGRRLERVPARRLFAFAWQDDRGPDAFWSGWSCFVIGDIPRSLVEELPVPYRSWVHSCGFMPLWTVPLHMEVRNATPADAEAIRDIARRSMEASYSLSPAAIDTAVRNWYSDEQFAEKFDDEELFVLVVESEDGVLGFSESTVVGDRGDVLWLHVDPMYRGEGVGTELFERTGEVLSEHGAESLRGRVLADNEQGNTFYEDHGLVRTGEGRVEIDDSSYVENIYTEEADDDLEPITGPDGARLFVDHSDTDRGSKGPFHVVWMDRHRGEAYGYFCGRCESLVTSMDAMGGMECDACGNHRKPTRWDAAYM